MRMTNKQIVKARKSVIEWVYGMKSGKYIRGRYDWKINKETKSLIYIGTTNIRQIIRIINDLIYYKSRCAELEKRLAELQSIEEVA